VVDQQLAEGAAKKRVGLVSSERMPVREGAKLVDEAGVEIGVVTSGTLGPTVGKPVALGYLAKSHSALGTQVYAIVRDKRTPMTVSSTPFTPNGYYRG